ncbi:hypothetical protein BH20ACT23_BH20ACT23_12190 [soil metagenome]
MRVSETMTADLLTVGRDDLVVDVARRMVKKWVGSAVVTPGPPGIITERDVLEMVGSKRDPGTARVADHFTQDAVCATPEWSLTHAAEVMSGGDFRHLPVLDGDRTVGIISIRDIIGQWVKRKARRTIHVQIREAMSRDLHVLDRNETLGHAARRMVDHKMGAALVKPAKPKLPPGIITDREVLETVAAGRDPEKERVDGHLSRTMTFSAPDWSLHQAAEAMTKGGFQHVVVVDGTGTLGIISMSDICRRWLD